MNAAPYWTDDARRMIRSYLREWPCRRDIGHVCTDACRRQELHPQTNKEADT